jgi:uncharacterized membrane protein YfcA
MDLLQIQPFDTLIIIVAFLIGGFVKGVVGVALPMLAMAILTMFYSVPLAVSLITIPTLSANIYQAIRPGEMQPDETKAAIRRFWPLLVTLVPGIGLGTAFLATLSSSYLMGCLGIAILVAVGFQIVRPEHPIPHSIEKWASPIIGTVSGLVGGVAGLYGPLMAVYMSGLRMPRNTFICSISIANVAGSLPLTLFIYFRGIADLQLLAVSLIATVPMFAGLIAGQRARHLINAHVFYRLLQIVLVIAGINFLRNSFS